MSKKKRLFGKVNYLDLMLILIIVGVIAFSFSRTNKYEELSQSNLDTAKVTIIAQEVTSNLVDSIEIGDTLWFSVKGSEFGTITSFTASPHRDLATGADGITYYEEFSDLYDVEIELTSEITRDEIGGIFISGNQVYIGQGQRLKSHIYVFTSLIDNFILEEE